MTPEECDLFMRAFNYGREIQREINDSSETPERMGIIARAFYHNPLTLGLIIGFVIGFVFWVAMSL